MSLFWKMCGVNVHLDTNIGKRLTLLTKALTALTGESDVADMSSVAEDFDVLREKTTSSTGHFGDGTIAQDLVDGGDGVESSSAATTGRKKPTTGTSKGNTPKSTFHRMWEEDSLEKQLLIQTTTVNELR